MSRTSVHFSYPHRQFIIKTVALLAMLLCTLVLLNVISSVDWEWSLLFTVLFAAGILLVGISPMLTRHEITLEGIRLRQGLLFSATFLFPEIMEVRRENDPLWTMVVPLLGKKGRIVLAGSNQGLVVITLKKKQRFGSLLFRSGDKIIIDLVKPDEFVRLANERLS